MKKKILAAILAGMAMFTGCSGKMDNTPEISGLSLNQETITAEEYGMMAQEYQNYIFMQYTTDQANAEDFWEQEIDGEIPYLQLADMVLEELKYNYAVKELAVETEVEEDYSYQELMQKMKEENEERAAQVEEQEVVYGLTSFDESSYYKYWYSNLETKAKNAWIQEESQITENDCKTYYEEQKQDEFSYEVGVSILYTEISYTSEEEQKEAQYTAVQLQHALETTDNVEEISEYFPDISIQQLELNSLDTQEGASGVYTQRWQIASSMEKGQVSSPFQSNGAYCLIKCIERTEQGFLEYDTVKAQIERYLQVQEADYYIQKLQSEMDVEINEEQIKKTILEFVQK